ncbi:MAG: thermonuclease family protein [Candidatus Omnitrophica bacterium]|nr:thermonuclease family protein [Candidatus Omnitrophota bacterium]MBU1923066.1 thermonuclease family protein [Candidatus Omnitrophota bacterium]
MRKSKTRQKKVILSLALGLLALTGYFFGDNLGLRFSPKEDIKPQAPVSSNHDYSNILVTRVVDGDTLKLEDGKYLRLLGIDTPEMHESAKLHRDALRSKQSVEAIKQLGRQSYEFTKQMVEGKRVRLEFDIERYDKYNRILAYVFLDDGTFLNARIVEEGYASLMTYPPNVKYADLFLKLYRQARENKRGLWR